MKKVIIIFLAIIGLVIVALAVAPIFFKDDIQKALDEQIDNNLNAKVYYSTEDFSLSFLSNFPNLSLSIGNFGVIGIEEFEEDTLASLKNFSVTVDIMSAISGEKIVVKNILLDRPEINVMVLSNGKANYDIAKETSEPEEEEFVEEKDESEATSDIEIVIEKWEIRDGQIGYTDYSSDMTAVLGGLNHIGTGDFSLEVFDLTTQTSIDKVSFDYAGENYLSNKTFTADLILNMDLGKMLFKFKENKLALNQFGFGFDGFVSMPTDDIEMDLTFEGKDIDIKGILSLIPGTYQEYLEGVTVGGAIGFAGQVKGNL